MRADLRVAYLRARFRLKMRVNAAAGPVAVAFLRILRRFDSDRSINFAGRFMARIGPWLREHRIGRANLAAAFPEKTAEEIDMILREVWRNVGRVAAEYAHLDRLWTYDADRPERGRVEAAPGSLARFMALRDGGRPSLFFAAHLGNWEMPAVVAAAHGFDAIILYRAPNIGDIADAINRIRAINMGRLVNATPEAPLQLAAALDRGEHVGMLVDQHYGRGVEGTLFGRPCRTNPLLARLARNFECPIHGVRTIRLPNNRFRFEITPEIAPARAADGRIDVTGTMQIVNDVIEGWVREYPEQWLWLHRRWR